MNHPGIREFAPDIWPPPCRTLFGSSRNTRRIPASAYRRRDFLRWPVLEIKLFRNYQWLWQNQRWGTVYRFRGSRGPSLVQYVPDTHKLQGFANQISARYLDFLSRLRHPYYLKQF